MSKQNNPGDVVYYGTPVQLCDHKFVYIRQEETEAQDYGHFGKGYKINDVFFCEKCLTYKKIAVAERNPNYRGIYERRELL